MRDARWRTSGRCRGSTTISTRSRSGSRERVATHPGLVAAVGNEALAAGGKRLRPALVFLSAPPGQEPSLAAGVAVELVHMATLVHDDLIDRAHFRRGKAAAWSIYGPAAARATGDYLFARAFSELSATGDAAAVEILADATLCLARGEALQRTQTRDPGTTVEAYLERCALKTGKLFEARAGSAAAPASTASRSGSRSRSPTTSSTARAPRSRPARSPAPTSATGRRPCPSCSRRSGTPSCAPRSQAARWTARSCALRRPAPSTSPARWRSTTLDRPGPDWTASCTETSSRP